MRLSLLHGGLSYGLNGRRRCVAGERGSNTSKNKSWRVCLICQLQQSFPLRLHGILASRKNWVLTFQGFLCCVYWNLQVISPRKSQGRGLCAVWKFSVVHSQNHRVFRVEKTLKLISFHPLIPPSTRPGSSKSHPARPWNSSRDGKCATLSITVRIGRFGELFLSFSKTLLVYSFIPIFH